MIAGDPKVDSTIPFPFLRHPPPLRSARIVSVLVTSHSDLSFSFSSFPPSDPFFFLAILSPLSYIVLHFALTGEIPLAASKERECVRPAIAGRFHGL